MLLAYRSIGYHFEKVKRGACVSFLSQFCGSFKDGHYPQYYQRYVFNHLQDNNWGFFTHERSRLDQFPCKIHSFVVIHLISLL